MKSFDFHLAGYLSYHLAEKTPSLAARLRGWIVHREFSERIELSKIIA